MPRELKDQLFMIIIPRKLHANKLRGTFSNQGCIINLEFIFLPPPPSRFIFFPQRKFSILRWCAPQAKFLSLFFVILQILSELEEKYAYFLQNAFPPLFSSPFNNFYSRCDIWAYFCPPRLGGGPQTEKYTPLYSKLCIVDFIKKNLWRSYKTRIFAF